MKKIPSLFKRNYHGVRRAYDEIVEGCEWVQEGQGIPTVKYDGTACMIQHDKLYKRYDRRPTKKAKKMHVEGQRWTPDEFRSAPPNWEPCEEYPDAYSAHWPGWVPVGDGPEDQYHREGLANTFPLGSRPSGTYELVGPKVQGNPYGLAIHLLEKHGAFILHTSTPRDFEGLRRLFEQHEVEGIVWHHRDGRMCKIKRKDFGLPWPPEKD